MGKSKKKLKAEEEAARQKALVQEKIAAKEAKEKAEREAVAEAAKREQEAEEERIRLEVEAKLQHDREEKENLAMKLQAVHRGRAARKAAKEQAMLRHDNCEVRQKVHGRTTANPLADDLGFFETENQTEKDFSSADNHVVEGRSLYCLGEESGVRHTFNDFLNHNVTAAFLLGCIIVNVVILSVETPTADISQSTRDLLHLADLLLSIIFSIEMVMRVISLGLIMHRSAYLRTSWNVLDFVVVISIWIGWATQTAGGHESEEGNISYLRTARALRPLRSLRMFGSIKKIMTSLYEAIPLILNVSGLILFFFVAFAAFGVSLYHGATTRSCLDSNTTTSIANGLPETINFTIGADYVECPDTLQCQDDEPGLCEIVPYEFTGDLPDEIDSFGFDNTRNALMTIFITTTLDEWPQLADPIRSAPLMADWSVWGFFALVVLICGMLGTNLFVAVVSFAFANVAEVEDGTSAFAKGQQYDTAADTEEEEHPPAEDTVTDESTEGQTDATRKKPGVPAVRSIVEHDYFEAFILTIVVLNTAVLASEHYDPVHHDEGGMSKEFADTLHIVELVFTVIYVIELIMKQIGLGPKEYFSSGFNILDFTLVCTSVISYAVRDLKGLTAGRMFRILRLFRAARLIKLMKRYYAVQKLLRTVTKSWGALLNVLFFIMIWLVIFAVMGIHLYGYDHEVFARDGLPRDNFHNFPRSLLTCYIILTGEDWSPLMYNFIHAYGWNAAIYFVAIFIMTNFVLTNLFVAVILENFSVNDEMKLEIQKRKYEAEKKRRMATSEAIAFEAEEALKQAEDEDDNPAVTQPAQNNGPRDFCTQVVENQWFETFIISIIALSSLCLGIEGPPDADYLSDDARTVLQVVDAIFFFVFWVECIFKIIAYGFVMPRGAYLSDGWNQLDFSVVVLTTIDFALRFCDSCSSQYSWIKVFRVARIMRPLRVASKFDNIRVIIDALIGAMGGVMAVLVLAGFIFLVFAVLGLNMFAGKFWMCQEEGFEILNRTECMAAGYEWANPDQHFDNIWHSLEALFVTATLEGWVEIMNRGMDVPDAVGLAPVEGMYPAHAIYFVVFTILASFFITNLFIGVLVNNFQESTGSAIMTDEQQQWAQFQMMLAMASVEDTEKQKAAELARAKPYQQTLLPIVNDHRFEIAITIAVGLNMVVLLLEHFPQTEGFGSFIDTANVVFLVLFTIELILQMLARGPAGYFKSNWFLMDFIVIMFSWILTFSQIHAGQNAARAIRMLRVMLILKFAKKARAMVMTIILSIGPATNVVMVLLLILYIYAVAGMQFYGQLEDSEKINDLENFRNIFSSLMFLFQISTGQDFKSIMFDIRAQDGFAVAAFFISFYVLSIFVFINLFVAVLLEAFEREFDDSIKLDLTAEDIVDFKNHWDGECEALLAKEMVEPKRNCLGMKSTNKSIQLRHLESFIERLPQESVVGEARGIGNQVVWWNRVLYELSVQPSCALHQIEPAVVHEAEQGQPQADPRLLSRLITFTQVVHACSLMRKTVTATEANADPLSMLTYGDRVELQEKLDTARTEVAMELLRASVNAWKMIRYPPQDVAERIAADANERKIWNMQVIIARTLMVCTIIERNKIG